jgi:hypothetical protein
MGVFESISCCGRTTNKKCKKIELVLGCFFDLAFAASASCDWKSI